MAKERLTRSPFPGMDPYLQRHWRAVHTMLIAYTCDAIQPKLPDDLVARVEEGILLDEDDVAIAARNPDVYVVESPVPWESRAAAAAAAGPDVAAAPILLEIDHDPLVERHIQITDQDGHRVITAIEILSPWNKEGKGREQYLAKREQYMSAKTNLVEIDLVRGASWFGMVAPHGVPQKHRTTYRVTVKRLDAYRLELYPIELNQRLPSIAIPLRPTDTDVRIDLQTLFDQVYVNGRCGRTDYAKACEPPLEGAMGGWADELLKTAGRR